VAGTAEAVPFQISCSSWLTCFMQLPGQAGWHLHIEVFSNPEMSLNGEFESGSFGGSFSG
jgi:hypothetical protein